MYKKHHIRNKGIKAYRIAYVDILLPILHSYDVVCMQMGR